MSTTPSSVMFFSDDLLTEFLSSLPVKSLLRFKCVSNLWNNLISDPNFVKFHLNRSKSRRNQHFTLITDHIKIIKGESPYGSDDKSEIDCSINIYPIPSLIDNPSFILITDPHSLLNEKDCSSIAGSCNGLICLTGYRSVSVSAYGDYEYEYWLRLWNPATRNISPKIGCFRDHRGFVFNFGCDNSTGTFKVVASRYIDDDHLTSEVRILSLDDNVWRNIESFPVVPPRLVHQGFRYIDVFLNGTLNWLAVHNDIPITWYRYPVVEITVEQIVIVSLDLETETYHQYRLPRDFDEVPPVEPTVGVLSDCLCFSYCYKETNFIIWQMKEFGVEESWTQFLKISYHVLQLNHDLSEDTLKYHLRLLPLFLSKDGDTLVLRSSLEREAILYNWRDNRVERTKVTVHKTSIDDGTRSCLRWDFAWGFVESLISIC